MIAIRPFRETDEDAVIQLVLHCQNDGTRPPVDVEDQPELLHIREKYLEAGGGFWVAEDDGTLAGCIGLLDHGDGVGILKKFFTYEQYRSAPHHLGRQLYGVLLEFAHANGFKRLYLDTPKNTERAHRFYERAGFEQAPKSAVPEYDYPYDDSDFFQLDLAD